jgi:voltage-gated potassium channel
VEHQRWRKRLAHVLDPELHTEPGLSPLNVVVITAICLSILMGVLETEPVLVDLAGPLFHLGHGLFFALFLVEFVVRLWVAPENPRHFGSRWHYLRTPAALLDLVVLISFLFPLLGMEAALLRVVRMARLIRLARLGRYSLALQVIYEAVAERRYELGTSIVIALTLMLLSSTALYPAERAAQPEAFGSIPRAMWWAVATLTTVGYGDVVPVTVLGRVFAALTALTGLGLIALPTGIMAGAFADALRKARIARRKD